MMDGYDGLVLITGLGTQLPTYHPFALRSRTHTIKSPGNGAVLSRYSRRKHTSLALIYNEMRFNLGR